MVWRLSWSSLCVRASSSVSRSSSTLKAILVSPCARDAHGSSAPIKGGMQWVILFRR